MATTLLKRHWPTWRKKRLPIWQPPLPAQLNLWAIPGSDGRNYHAHLEGLSPSTQYYFQVTQKDEPVGGVGTFRTVPSGAIPVKSKATIPQQAELTAKAHQKRF